MRLIDADALERIILSEGSYQNMVGVLEEEIDNTPTIDAVEVVRCKDCKWYSNQHLCVQLSRFGSVEPLADFYCAFGERREP